MSGAQPVLHLISGMAGAGNTKLARQIEQGAGAIRLSPDEWLLVLMRDVHDRAEMDRLRASVEALQWTVARQFLERGQHVVLENGCWARQERLNCCAGARVREGLRARVDELRRPEVSW